MNLSFDKQALAEICQKNDIAFLGVFGSVARGDNKPDSDIDLLVRFRPQAKVGFFELVRAENQLSQALGRKVDLVPEGGVSPYIAPKINRDLVTLYD